MRKNRGNSSSLFAGLARVLSPRGSFAMAKVSGALPFALRAALTMALPTLPLVLLGHPQLAFFPALGAFTITFERSLPMSRRRRLWMLALVGATMTVAVGLGSLLAVWAGPSGPWFQGVAAVAGMAAVAGLAKFGCDYAGLRGLGAVLILLSFAVTAEGTPGLADVLPHTALAALGAAVAWLVCLPNSLQPQRLQRLALSDALNAFARALDAAGPAEIAKARHQAVAAALRAYHALNESGGGEPDQSARPVYSADFVWSLLTDDTRRSTEDAEVARRLREQARVLADRRWHTLLPLPEELLDGSPHARSGDAVTPAEGAAATLPPLPPRTDAPRPLDRRTRVQTKRGGPGRRRAAALLPTAVRTAVGTAVAGGLALFLGVGHSYWAAISAAAVLHSVNVWSTVQRSVQRTIGTAVGLLITSAVLVMHPSSLAIICLIIVFEFLLEYVVARNYGLGVVFLTPLALLLSELSSPVSAERLLHDRVVGSVIGISVGLVCALLLVHGRAAERLRDALAASVHAADRAQRALSGTPGQRRFAQVQLAAASVELYEAKEAARGELRPSRVDPATVTAAQHRAYDLLGRLSHAMLRGEGQPRQNIRPPSHPDA
ncbi:FUSC family protein [Streptomyces sp. DSM 110735]|uniref:FUSC family protein n=1 Tax=Streptomyces sp. DSM 110735 TaxID=2775031 RepID=UPI0018F5B720|nr:FUSC family protein [Streptomyces sp. DSM 110735]MBJ7907464.1 FUSC family protein [Streptomyces sp. DSM 110735]